MMNLEKTFTPPSFNGNPIAAPTQVAGDYQIMESRGVGADQRFVPLPVFIKVTQRPDFIGLELFNEEDNTSWSLNYPMKGVAVWNPDFNAAAYTRAIGDTFVVDITSPQTADSNILTRRVTWKKDSDGNIHENFENFDASGNRLESSQGHFRVLVPVART